MMFNASNALPIWDDGSIDGAFTLQDPSAAFDAAVVTSVQRPWLFEYTPVAPNGRAMLVLGGGGYTQLMVGREGVAIARWLAGLGFHAFVLVHRFPTAASGPHASTEDAMRAMRLLRNDGRFPAVGVVGLSSGGHLAATLLADWPAKWPVRDPLAASVSARPDLAVIGYAPISTNAKDRTVVADKPPLAPVEKQALYDRLQPDAQLQSGPPPSFIVYSASDPVVPVENAYRLHHALVQAGGASELHVFANAPHGFALDTPGLPVSLWPQLCEAWLRQQDFLDAE